MLLAHKTHVVVMTCITQAEYRALNDVFPQSSLRMNSTKSMIGHLLGGAGAVEAIATIKAIETGVSEFHLCIDLLVGLELFIRGDPESCW